MKHDDPSKPRCPLCGSQDSRTLQTRFSDARDGSMRRRECLYCGARFTTLELVLTDVPAVRFHPGRLAEMST